MSYNILIGIDPAFRSGGFTICIIDLSDKTIRYKSFKNGFLDFCSWFLHDSPDEALFCVENSNKTDKTFWTHRNKKTGALLTKAQAKFNRYAQPLSVNELCKISRDVGKNQGASQYAADLIRTKYPIIDLSPLEKGPKWLKNNFVQEIIKGEGLTAPKKTTNQDERDALKLALIAKKRRNNKLPPLGYLNNDKKIYKD